MQVIRRFGKALGRGLLGLGAVGGALWVFGPYEPVDLKTQFDRAQLEAGVEAYFARVESSYDDITPGTEKRVIWAGAAEQQTPVSVVYIHGFSSSSEEIRPLPDRVAEALGANLVFTRLAGHARGTAAMAEPELQDWMQDVAEALAVARKVGERVVVISTSTGGTLMALAELDPELRQGIAAQIFVSPNFALHDGLDLLLTLPAVRYWGPIVAGEERSFKPRSEAHATFWTTRYPTVALLPMAAAVRTVQTQDWSQAQTPALFYYALEDRVVDPEGTRRIAAQWGGRSTVVNPQIGPDDDPFVHLIAGDIMSPGQTEPAVATLLEWLAEQGID